MAGLGTRKFPNLLPDFVAAYGGDALWAMMIFFAAGLAFAHWPTRWLVVFSLMFCYVIEISQLYHAPWIDAIRDTRLGGLILGYTFSWSDLLCYTTGVGFCVPFDILLSKRNANNETSYDS